MPVVSVSMPSGLLEQLDAFVEEYEYTGRSEAVREGARTLLSEFEGHRLEGRALAAVVSVLYDFGTRSVDRRIARLRHEHEDRIATNVHSHVDDYCMELFVIEGDLEAVAAFVERARSIEAVETVDYSLLALDTDEPPFSDPDSAQRLE